MVMKVPVRPTPALEGEGGDIVSRGAVSCSAASAGEASPPAVDHDGTSLRLVLLHHSPVEGQDGRGIVGHPVVRPGREVEMGHLQRTLRAARQLGVREEREHDMTDSTRPTVASPYLHNERACGVVCQRLLVGHGHLEGAKVLCVLVRPVLVALGLASLHEVGDHHNGGSPLLPHQPPEVHHSLGQGT